MLFCVGGDGTQRRAHAIDEEITRRGLKIAVGGVPKTIDNNIMYIYRMFGFATALEIAQQALACAHVEAKGAPNGIGLVKLMGRDAGFIAAGATLASQEVNFCLVPEVDVPLEGPIGFLPSLKRRILDKQHAVIVVAEGALYRPKRSLRRIWQPSVSRHRHLFARQDCRVLQAGKCADRAQIHRP
jgi:6-phosphofructokinase 1